MTEYVRSLKHYLCNCLHAHKSNIDLPSEHNELAKLAYDWLDKLEKYEDCEVYSVWFAIRELVLNKFSADPSFSDVVCTVMNNISEFCKTDGDVEYHYRSCEVRGQILYDTECMHYLINHVCSIAAELRSKYNANIDFSDIEDRDIDADLCNDTITCTKRKIPDDQCVHEMMIDLRNYLQEWCSDNSKDPYYENGYKITLVDIAGIVVKYAIQPIGYFPYDTSRLACVLYTFWYAMKMWMMLDNSKNYHSLDEIREIVKTNNIDLQMCYNCVFMNDDMSSLYKDVDLEDKETYAICSIQRCEQLINTNIEKYTKFIRTDVSDIPFELFKYVDLNDHTDGISFVNISNMATLIEHKDMFIKFIDNLARDNAFRMNNDDCKNLHDCIDILKNTKFGCYDAKKNRYLY